MNLPPTPHPYKRHRFPAEIISHWVWRYWRFGLRDREVEALLAERGISLTDEAGRSGCRQFGHAYANVWRRRRSSAGDKWPLDAVCLTINKARHDLWRAVDQGGNSRAILVQWRRAQAAAQKFFREFPPNRPASASGGCRRFTPQGMPSAFSPPTGCWPSPSARGVTGSLPQSSATG